MTPSDGPIRHRTPVFDRQEFAVERGWLVRTVQGPRGTYQHRCSLEAYQAVAWFVEDHADEGVTTGMLWQGLPDVPSTQASVAMAFLKERGCLAVRGRRCYPTSRAFFEDAMVEFHALEAAGG